MHLTMKTRFHHGIILIIKLKIKFFLILIKKKKKGNCISLTIQTFSSAQETANLKCIFRAVWNKDKLMIYIVRIGR